MAVAGMTAADEHAVSALLESLEDELGVDPAAAHHPYYVNIWRIFQAGGTSQVGATIRAPVTKESHNPRLELNGHI
jgi:hypothetical protein